MGTPQHRKSDAQALSGQMIAHYRVARPLGSGGISEVFLAEAIKPNRAVALDVQRCLFIGNLVLARVLEFQRHDFSSFPRQGMSVRNAPPWWGECPCEPPPS